jgi:acyl dehydratase
VESEIQKIAVSRTRPDRGIVTVCNTTFNQVGEVVQVMTAKQIVFRRTVTPA